MTTVHDRRCPGHRRSSSPCAWSGSCPIIAASSDAAGRGGADGGRDLGPRQAGRQRDDGEVDRRVPPLELPLDRRGGAVGGELVEQGPRPRGGGPGGPGAGGLGGGG